MTFETNAAMAFIFPHNANTQNNIISWSHGKRLSSVYTAFAPFRHSLHYASSWLPTWPQVVLNVPPVHLWEHSLWTDVMSLERVSCAEDMASVGNLPTHTLILASFWSALDRGWDSILVQRWSLVREQSGCEAPFACHVPKYNLSASSVQFMEIMTNND